MRQTAARFFSLTLNALSPRFPNYIQPIAAKLNLGLPAEAKLILNQKQTRLPIKIRISRKHVIDEAHVRFLTGPEHALTAMYLSFYTDRTPQPLVIRTYSRTGREPAKVVVKNRAATRLRRAFCVALNKTGYSWLGAGISRQLGTKGEQLYGSVVLDGVHPQKIMLLEFPKLVDYFSERIRHDIAPKLRRVDTNGSSEMLSTESELEPGILDEHRE
ncbi:hypothetical protein V8F20_000782 [Naviculisporaceae sp. PSN 640]